MQRIPVVKQSVQKSGDTQNSNNNTKANPQQTSSSLPSTSSSSSSLLQERKILQIHSASLPSIKIIPNSSVVSTIGSIPLGGSNDDNKRGIVVIGGRQQQQNIGTAIPLTNSTGQSGNLFFHGNKIVQLQYKTATSSSQGKPLSLVTASGNKKIPITLVSTNTILSKGTGKTITSPSLIPISTSSNFLSIGSTTLQTVNKINQKPIITSVQSASKITPNILQQTKAIDRRVLPAATVIAVTPSFQQKHQQFSPNQPLTIIKRNSIKQGPPALLSTNPEITSITVDRKSQLLLTSATNTITTPTVLCKNSSSSNLTDKLHTSKTYSLPPLTPLTPLQSIQTSLPALKIEQKMNTVKTSSTASSASSALSKPPPATTTTTSVTSDSEETKTLSLKNFEVFEQLHQAEAALNVKYDYNFDDQNYNTDTDENIEIFSSSTSSKLPSQQQEQQKQQQQENDDNYVKDDKHQLLFKNKTIENIKTSPRTEKRSKSLTTDKKKYKKKIYKKRQLSLGSDNSLKITSKNENSKSSSNEKNNDDTDTDNLPTLFSLLCNETIEISPTNSYNSNVDKNDNKTVELVSVEKQQQTQQEQKDIEKEQQQEIKEKQIKIDINDNKTKESNIIDDSKIFKVPQMVKKKIMEKYNHENMLKMKGNLNDRLLTGVATKDKNKNVIDFLKSDYPFNFLDWSNEGVGRTKDERVNFRINNYGLIEVTDKHIEKNRKGLDKNIEKKNLKKTNSNNNDNDYLKYLPSTSSGLRSESYSITNKNLSTTTTSTIISDQQNIQNDDDIFVKPTSKVMKSKPAKKQLRSCFICNRRISLTDFLAYGYCSFNCIQKMQKEQNRRKSSLYNKNDKNNIKPIEEDEITDNNKTDDKNNKKSIKKANTTNDNETDDNKTDDTKADDKNNDKIKPMTTRRILKRKCNEIQEQKKQPPALSYYKRKKLEKQMQQLQENKKNNFDWSTYLKKHNAKAAPRELFKTSLQNTNNFGKKTIQNPFKSGMKIEAIDPEHQSLFCVCTIVRVNGHRLKLHFDGYSIIYDFWVNSNSKNIFPPGWCKKTNRHLEPPFGMTSSQFNWQSYLRKTKSIAAPESIFKHLNESTDKNPFEIGMKLEADDLKNTRTVCVASVSDILGDRILVHFDGWHDLYDYWIEIDSPYIHHVNWHKECGNSIYPPPHWEMGSFTWEEYYKEGQFKSTKRINFPKTRLTLPFQIGQKLEVVDKKNPSLIRPATIIDIAPYELRIIYDGWLQRYAFWIMDDSPNLYPVGWCEANGHDLEPPPGYTNLPTKMPCPILNCRGIGNARGNDIEYHSNEDSCPYHPVNWRDKTELPDRLQPNETKTKPEKKVAVKRKNEDLKNANPKPIKIIKGTRTNKKNINTTTTTTKTTVISTKPVIADKATSTKPIRLTKPKLTTKSIISTTENNQENTRILRKSQRLNINSKINYEMPNFLIPPKKIKIEPIDDNEDVIIDDVLDGIENESVKTREAAEETEESIIEVTDTTESIIHQPMAIETRENEEENDKTNIKKDLNIENTLSSQSSTVNETITKTTTDSKTTTEMQTISTDASETFTIPKIKTEKSITNEIEASAFIGFRLEDYTISKLPITIPKIKTEKPIANAIASTSTGVKAKTSKTTTVSKITAEKSITNAIASASTGVKAKTSKTTTVPKITAEKSITNEIEASASDGFRLEDYTISEIPITISKIKTEKPIANAIASTSNGVTTETSETYTISEIKNKKLITNSIASASTGVKAKTSKTTTVPKITAEKSITNAKALASNDATTETSKTYTISKIKPKKSIANAIASASTGSIPKTYTISKSTTETPIINTIPSGVTGVTARTSKDCTIQKIKTEIPIINAIASGSTGAATPSNNNKKQNELDFKNISMHVASNLLCDYGPRLDLAYNIWFENSLHILRNPKESIFDSVVKNPLEWTDAEVSKFLYNTIQIELEIVRKLAECQIDGPSFLAMRQTDLTNILEINLGPSIKIYNFILQLRVIALTKFKTANKSYIHGSKFVFQHHKIEDLKAIKDAKSAKAAKIAAKLAKIAAKAAKVAELEKEKMIKSVKAKETSEKATQTSEIATQTSEKVIVTSETKATQTEIQPELEDIETITTNKKTKTTKNIKKA